MAEERTKNKDSVWIEGKDIVHIFESRPFTEESVLELAQKARQMLKKFNGKAKVLFRLTKRMRGRVTTPQVRKLLTEAIIGIIKDPGFEKAAVYEGTITSRTIASFILGVIGAKNIKIFKTKEQAIKWLRK